MAQTDPLTKLPTELLTRILALLPLEDRVTAASTCRATARLLDEAKLWQAAVLQNSRPIAGREYSWADVQSLRRWIRRHGPTVTQLEAFCLPAVKDGDSEVSAAAILLGDVTAGAQLSAVSLHFDVGQYLTGAALQCLATVGPTLRQLRLDMRLTLGSCASGLEHVLGSLPHLQDLAVTYYTTEDDEERYHPNEIPDALNLAASAARHCPALRLLSLNATNCWQHRVRSTNGHGGLEAVSMLTQLSCLQLVDCAITHWPTQLNSLPLRQLAVRNISYDIAAEVDTPLPHGLAAMTRLHTLYLGVFTCEDALPAASLRTLMLECGELPWLPAQFPALLRQLAAMPSLATLSIRGARWLQREPGLLQQLVDALRRCRRLRSLRLGCEMQLQQLPQDLSGIAHLETLVLGGGSKPEHSAASAELRRLAQLTACKRLNLRSTETGAPAVAASALFAVMPELQQLRLGVCEHPDEIIHVCWRRPGGTPQVQERKVPRNSVNWLWHGEVRIPFKACNDLLGQQLTTRVL